MSYRAEVNKLARDIHEENIVAGWWNDQCTIPLKYLVSTKIALIHSEVSEGLEGFRKNLMDDHLPHRPMLEVELADAVIRILDLADALGYDIGGAIEEKRKYNEQRLDHKLANRDKPGGKSI